MHDRRRPGKRQSDDHSTRTVLTPKPQRTGAAGHSGLEGENDRLKTAITG